MSIEPAKRVIAVKYIAALMTRSVPGAVRGPRAGSPRGVVDATGSIAGVACAVVTRSLSLPVPTPSRRLIEVTNDLTTNPFTHRHRNPIPDHSIRIIIASAKGKRVRHPLQPRILANRVRSHPMRKSPIDHQPCTQVLRVMSNARRRDVAAFRIADDWPVAIRSR